MNFNTIYFTLDTALRRNKKLKKDRREKNDSKNTESFLAIDSLIDGTNDAIEVEDDLCVIELPASDQPNKMSVSDVSFVEMSAVDKLKSQEHQQISTSNTVSSGGGGLTIIKANRKRKTRRGSGTSSEEERWLDAIESGKLE